MDIKSLFPESLFARAYEFNSEFAWKPEDLPAIADALRSKKIAVLGGEVWLKTDGSPLITPEVYQWTIEKQEAETLEDYTNRSLDEMVKFAEGLSGEPKLKEKWNDVYVNLQLDEVKSVTPDH